MRRLSLSKLAPLISKGAKCSNVVGDDEFIETKDDENGIKVRRILDQNKTFWRSNKSINVTINEHTQNSQSEEISLHGACIEVIAHNLKTGEEAPHLYFDSRKVFSNARYIYMYTHICIYIYIFIYIYIHIYMYIYV